MHCGVHCRLFHWFLEKCFLVEVHPYITCFCTFWQSAFSVTCFGVFFLGGGNKCVGVNVYGVGIVLGWNVLEDDACSIGFDLYPSQHQEGLRLHVHGGKGLFVRVSYVTGM